VAAASYHSVRAGLCVLKIWQTAAELECSNFPQNWRNLVTICMEVVD
jgi:hypothetical protein